ncbi:hypothetical protein F2P56_023812 [Juglans regia]|uniref:Ribonuclease 1-like n=2 Tax=Juglans regia TaxID=51240 RepID=A0A2I4HPT9_JUGRE|nr:ribonuclease 1-like [Juglans regia]KAF5454124.1 hypothetical protein F2P56_023812 [Juglans regia]
MEGVLILLCVFTVVGVGHYSHVVAYDYMYLVMQWPRSFCNTQPNVFRSRVPNIFTIHGLWPQNLNNAPVNCPVPILNHFHYPTLNADKVLLKTMDRIWPSLINGMPNDQFWGAQWKKHGTCTTYAQNDYFRVDCIRANFLGNITASLEAQGILVGTSSLIMFYKRAIEEQLHLIPNFACNEDSNGTPQLFEIRFCLDKAGLSFKNCSWFIPRKCSGNIAFPIP